MFTILLSFIKSHLQVTLIVSAVLAVLGTLEVQHLAIAHLDAKLAECRAESVTLENSNRALVASIDRQDAAMAALAEVSRKRQAAAVKAMAQAKAAAGRYAQAARRIEGQTGSGDDCTQMRKLIEDFTARETAS